MRRWGPNGPAEVMPAPSHGWWKGWRGPKPLTADFGDRGRGFNALSAFREARPITALFAKCSTCPQISSSRGTLRRNPRTYFPQRQRPPVKSSIWLKQQEVLPCRDQNFAYTDS